MLSTVALTLLLALGARAGGNETVSANPSSNDTAPALNATAPNNTLPTGHLKDIRPWAQDFSNRTGCEESFIKWTCVRPTNYYFPAAKHIASYGEAWCDSLETNNTLTLRHEFNPWNVGPQNMTHWSNETGISYTGINMAIVSEDKKVRYNFWSYSTRKNEMDPASGPRRWYGCRNAISALWDNCFAATETPGGWMYQFGTWEDGTEAYRITIDYLNHTEAYNNPTGVNHNTTEGASTQVPLSDHVYWGNMTQTYDYKCSAPLRPVPNGLADPANREPTFQSIGQDADKAYANGTYNIPASSNTLNNTSSSTTSSAPAKRDRDEGRVRRFPREATRSRN